MKILILNRRDIKNPVGGGAEYHTHEIAKGLVESYGCEVTVFSSRFKGAEPQESLDGVFYRRKGNELTVHFHGFLYARGNRKKFDLIIDQFNGIGFFTFSLPRSVLWIHQLYREFWMRELGPVGLLPYWIEPLLLRLYRKRPAIALSDSTRLDLDALGFRRISIVSTAMSKVPLAEVPHKESPPTLIFLGRLRSTKRPEDAIRIYEAVKREVPDARLWMVGRGPEEERLKRLSSGIEGITFWGWVDEERKLALLREAHVLIVPSVREGFGINVIEAASQGTPSVGYDVPGLRDSIKNGTTGFLTKGPEDAARKAVDLLLDPRLYNKMSSSCLEYAREFNWQRRTEEFWRVIRDLGDKP